MPDPGLDVYARELASRVSDATENGKGGIYNEQEFTRIVLEELGEEGAIEDPVALWYEGSMSGRVCKITGCSMPDDNERLTLITTIYHGEVPPVELSTDEKLSAYHQAIKFFEDSRNGLYEKIDPSMGEIRDFSRRIYEARDVIDVLRVILISDQIAGFGHADLKGAFDDTRIVVDPYGVDRLYRLLGKGLTRDDIIVEVERELQRPLPCLKVSNGRENYDAYLAALPGSLLADIYEKYGTRLLELNVRAFLGLGGKKSVNAGLRSTIRQSPDKFLAYNNGLVTTVDDIELEHTASGQLGIRKLRGLQIVNGGQTTASLHRALLHDHADLQDVQVPVKIIRVSGAELNEMVAAVSRSANSQNTVQPADFSANEPFHVAVENLANNVWIPEGSGRWFYERARGSYRAARMALGEDTSAGRRFLLETPKERIFAKTDLAKYLNAWNGLPHLVSYGSQKNFQYFMQALKDEHSTGFAPDEKWYREFIAKLVIFRATQDIVKKQKFAAYQAIISAYTVASLAQRYQDTLDLEFVWSRQAISPQLASLINLWAIAIDKALRRTAGSRMPSEWAKRVECWDTIRATKFDVPAELPPELHAPVQTTELESKEPEIADGNDAGNDIGSLILRLRPLFAKTDSMSREEFKAKLTEIMGYPITDPKSQQETETLIQAAVARGILQDEGHELSLLARSISEYPREVLKAQFLASLNGTTWTERSESIPRFARWLGFRRTGPNIEEAARSVINSLIRSDRLEKTGSQIRRI